MDKNTVKKFKEAFNHWLEGGSVLYRYKKEADFAEEGWMAMSDGVNFFSDRCIYVANDKYVEFRIADAMGRQVQYNPLSTMHHRWDDLQNLDGLNCELRNLRLKAEKIRFKIGDWVSSPKKNHLITTDNIAWAEKDRKINGSVDFWAPVRGEWVCMYCGDRKYGVAVTQYSHQSETHYVDVRNNIYTDVKPIELIDILRYEKGVV